MNECVPRPTLAIGDLYGSHDALLGNLKGSGALDSAGNWARPGCDLVILGDAIGDRETDDVEIVNTLNRLRAQVQAVGGIYSGLWGNHELTMAHFLGINWLPFSETVFRGVLAVAQLANHGGTSLLGIHLERKEEKRQQGEDGFLSRLKETPGGSAIVQYLLGLDLYTVRGTTLFTHTPPSQELLGCYLNRPANLNEGFRRRMKELLQEPTESLSAEERKQVKMAETAFLDSYNREVRVPGSGDTIWADLAARENIHSIVFGHDFVSRGFWDGHNIVSLMGIDFGYGRPKGKSNEHSTAWILPHGQIQTEPPRA